MEPPLVKASLLYSTQTWQLPVKSHLWGYNSVTRELLNNYVMSLGSLFSSFLVALVFCGIQHGSFWCAAYLPWSQSAAGTHLGRGDLHVRSILEQRASVRWTRGAFCSGSAFSLRTWAVSLAPSSYLRALVCTLDAGSHVCTHCVRLPPPCEEGKCGGTRGELGRGSVELWIILLPSLLSLPDFLLGSL